MTGTPGALAASGPDPSGDPDASKVVAVIVTHRRAELLKASTAVIANQSRPVDHLVVVDNADEQIVADHVASLPIPTTYIGSQHNLGGAGGFALGMLHALALGADWVWCADDDGRPEGPEVLATLLRISGIPGRRGAPLKRGVRTQRLRYHSALPLLSDTPWIMPSPMNQWPE